MHQYWLTSGKFVAALTVVTVAAVVIPRSLRDTNRDPPDAGENPQPAGCEKFLTEFRSAWQPAKRAEFVQRAREQREVLGPQILHILRRPGGELTAQAVYFAGELEIAESRPFLKRLSRGGQPQIRASAMIAAHRIEPWTDDELEEFVQDKDASVLAAVPKLFAGRSMTRLFPLLGHDHEPVRAAVLAALPARLSPMEWGALLKFATAALGEDLRWAVRAFGRSGMTEAAELFLDDLLGGRDATLNALVLEALSGKASALFSPGTVLALATNPGFDLDSRARALWCLERTGSVPRAALCRELPGLHPFLKYFAARCLASSTGKVAATGLLGVLRARDEDFVGMDKRRIEQVRAATRKLLGTMAGIGPNADLERWEEWHAAVDEVAVRALPASPIRFH